MKLFATILIVIIIIRLKNKNSKILLVFDILYDILHHSHGHVICENFTFNKDFVRLESFDFLIIRDSNELRKCFMQHK